MPISCEDLAALLADLEAELAEVEALIAEINDAFANEPDPMVRMMLTMDLSQAYQDKFTIEQEILYVQMNQDALGCNPPAAGSPSLAQSKHLELHERLRKFQTKRFIRKCGVKSN